MKDRTWWLLLGCSLPFIPLLWLAVPVFYLGVWWMAANGLPREVRR
jgi:hypothetical protein